MRATRRRTAAGSRTAAALAAVLGLAACTGGPPAEDPAAVVARDYLTAWSQGRLGDAARLTDAPAEAEAALTEARDGLRLSAVATRPGTLTRPSGEGSAPTVAYEATLSLTGLGDWTYTSALPMLETGQGEGTGRWRVDWAPTVVHPALTPTTRLGRARELPERAPILDRDGTPLMAERPVVEVGIEPRTLRDPRRAYAALGPLGVDTARLAARVKAAKPTELVPVITLRQADFAKVEGKVSGIPGVLLRPARATLGPTATYARALLGTVRPATAETLADAGPTASSVDAVGASGLQRAYQRQLAGSPGGEVRLVQRAGGGLVSTLHTFPATPGTALRTTLDDRVQTAAERALAAVEQPAALVAVQPSTGQVLAAANSAASGGFNRAFAGRYPPGSTFKVVTTAALLQAGLDPAEPVACPDSVLVEGKRFGNYDGLAPLGTVAFRRSFTESCNTAFIGAARPLPSSALPEAAGRFGLGAAWDLGVEAFSGSVPEPAGAVDAAASAIGQGRVLASPLAMALVAAAVRDGTARPPVLLAERPPSPAAPAPLPDGVAGTLRGLMQETVSRGTASVLRLPGRPVGAKTGTAEYGAERPPRTHAWMVGFRPDADLAFAVLVEDGESGSRTAGPVARAFLQAAPAAPG